MRRRGRRRGCGLRCNVSRQGLGIRLGLLDGDGEGFDGGLGFVAGDLAVLEGGLGEGDGLGGKVDGAVDAV